MRLGRFCSALLLGALALFCGKVDAQLAPAFDRALLDEHNAARTDPAGYAAHLEALLPYFEGSILRRPGSRAGLQTNEGSTAVREAIRALRQQAPLPPLEWADGLALAARDHVRDQGPSGATGHDGTDGSSMDGRVRRYGAWNGTAAENIDYGSANARDVLISLIVDDGVPSRGHRRNIFNPNLRVMGGACGPHTRYRRMCVLDYAGEFTPTSRKGKKR
jgi:uncharacterized protein YkwD